MSFLGFLPSVVTLEPGVVTAVDYQISHAGFIGTDPCYYFAFIDYGGANTWLSRNLRHLTSPDLIGFNVYSSPSAFAGTEIRLATDATSNQHVLYNAPQFFPVSGSSQVNTNQMYVLMPTVGPGLAPGIYSESLIFRVAARPINPPAGDWSIWPVVLSRAVQVRYQIAKDLYFSLVASGDVFDSNSTSMLMTFGDMRQVSTRQADVIIQTNVGYKLYVSSKNNGKLIHNQSPAHSVSYIFTLAGTDFNLAGSLSLPLLVSQNANPSTPFGYILPLQIELQAITGSEAGGDYSDQINFYIEAF